jgi:hypothetical protein
VGTIGVDSAIAVFDATSQVGNSFSTTNGAWYCLGGASGPDTISNKVLIAQITTDGILSFELNIQIGTPVSGTSEYYVANNPSLYNGQMELTIPSLSYTSPVDTVTDTTSIETNEFKSNIISIFPNPSNGVYYLNIVSSNYEKQNDNYYKVYDLIGNVILFKRIEMLSEITDEKIDLSSCTSGIYFAEVTIDGDRRMIKLIKSK